MSGLRVKYVSIVPEVSPEEGAVYLTTAQRRQEQEQQESVWRREQVSLELSACADFLECLAREM